MATLEITNLNVFVAKDVNENTSNIGFGSVQFNDLLWMNFRVNKYQDRIFIGWPSFKKANGEYAPHVWFKNGDDENTKSSQRALENYIIEEFNKKFIGSVSSSGKKEPLVSIRKKQDTQQQNFSNEQLVSSVIDDEDEKIFQSCIKKDK